MKDSDFIQWSLKKQKFIIKRLPFPSMSSDSQSTEGAATPIGSSTVSDRDVIVTNSISFGVIAKNMLKTTTTTKNWVAQAYKQGFMNDLHGFFS